MERRTRRAWLLVALAVAFVAVLGLAPKTALADGDVVEVSTGEALKEAFEGAPTDGSQWTIRLTGNFSVNETLKIATGKNIVLDLSGHTLSFNSGYLWVNGSSLTISDSGENGTFAGTTASSLISVSGGGSALRLEGGSIAYGGADNPAIKIASISGSVSFVMTGGAISAPLPLQLQYTTATATISGGSITSTSDSGGTAIELAGGNPSLTVGEQDEFDAPKISGNINIKAGDPTLNLLGGTVGGITGEIPAGSTLKSHFTQQISAPSDKECIKVDDHWEVVDALTEENAAAKIVRGDDQTILFRTAASAASSLRDGDTLVLLQNVTGTVDANVNGSATIDLNGHSITSTEAYALTVRQGDNSSGTVTVKNSAPTAASLTGTVSGLQVTSSEFGDLELDYQPSNITLAPAAAGIELGNARIPFNEANARLVPNGGFRTVHNGKPYIYGTLSAAVADADANTEITLLNDYDGAEPMFVSTQSTFVVDLGGHTYRTTAACAAQVATAHADVTFKNGTIVSAAPTEEAPNIVGAYLKGTGISDVSITLDNVDLTMEHSGNAGIIVQGLNTDNTVTLNGCTLTVPDDVMGIYFPPADSSLVINDTIINAGTGIGIKGGSLTVSGSSEIHAHGAYEEAVPTENGISETGDAIYVDGGYADNDGRNVTVAIENGSFSSENGNSIQELVVGQPGSNSPVKIAVSAGSFDDTSVAGYLVPDAAVAVGADGSCTVYPSVEEARANGGGYQVVDEAGNTWFFSTPEAAAEFAKGQGGSAKVEEVLWTVTFDDCLDSTENQTVSVRNGEPVARPAEDPVCAGYRFLGWYSDKALTQAWDFGTPVHGDLTLYAKWEQVGGSTSAEKPATPGSDTTTADDGLAKTGDPTLVALLAASALAGASALGAALGLRRRDR